MKDTKFSFWKGRRLAIEVFGASHDRQIGGTLYGLSSFPVDLLALQAFCDRRKPATAFATPRKEDDVVSLSGLENGKTTGVVSVRFENRDVDSVPYVFADTPRPSHADYVGYTKYENFDGRGGGKFSGRLTAPLVCLGGICKQILSEKGVSVEASVQSIGGETCQAEIENLLKTVQAEKDSVGGIVSCTVTGLPVGVGEYMFDSLEGSISRLLFAIPAVKGVAFGSGFDLAAMRGSQANDAFVFEDGKVRTKTNHSGGINGGISNGMPLTFTVAIRPTPSIGIEQDTVNLRTGENAKITIEGRHDVCIVPRCAVCVEAVCAVAILDNIMSGEEA